MLRDLPGNLSVEGKGLTQRKLVQIIIELVSEKPRLNPGAPLLAEVTCLHAELFLRDLREKQSNQGRIGCALTTVLSTKRSAAEICNRGMTCTSPPSSKPRVCVNPKFCFCRLISTGVLTSVMLATGLLMSLQKKSPRSVT